MVWRVEKQVGDRVQAQEVVASAESDYIANLNAHNLAKASVARATGQAEKIMRDLLRSQ
jgi:hypothetical protein